MNKHILTSSLTAFALASSASGVVVASLATETGVGLNGTGFTSTVADDDLLQTEAFTETHLSDFDTNAAAALSLSDGVISTSSATDGSGGRFGVNGDGRFIEYIFTDTQVDIESLVLTVHWSDRTDMGFIVSTSTDGVNFTPSTIVVDGLDNPAGAFGDLTPGAGITNNVINQLTISDDTGANLFSGVQGIRFDFTPNNPPGGNQFNGVYREIDIIGVAVPEPSSALLGLLGGLVAFRRRR